MHLLCLNDLYLDIARASRTPNSVHHPLDALLDQGGAGLHEFGQGGAASLLLGIVLILPQDNLIDIEAGHAGVDTLLEDLGGELVGAVHDQGDFSSTRVTDALQAGEVELDVLDAIVGPVDVSDGGGEEVDAGVDELQGLFGGGQDALEVAGVLDTSLAAVDAAGLCLGGDAEVVAELDQLSGAGQVLLLLVVAHVDHNAVELARQRGLLDPGLALRVVQVQRHGHTRAAAHVRRQVHQVVVRVLLRPREQQDLAR